jgi:hypothetical protein
MHEKNHLRQGMDSHNLPFPEPRTARSIGGIRSTISINPTLAKDKQPGYFANSPEELQVAIPKELFTALWDFLEGERPAGSVTIHFRNGGVAGLEALIKKHYK